MLVVVAACFVVVIDIHSHIITITINQFHIATPLTGARNVFFQSVSFSILYFFVLLVFLTLFNSLRPLLESVHYCIIISRPVQLVLFLSSGVSCAVCYVCYFLLATAATTYCIFLVSTTSQHVE